MAKLKLYLKWKMYNKLNFSIILESTIRFSEIPIQCDTWYHNKILKFLSLMLEIINIIKKTEFNLLLMFVQC